LNKDEVLTTRTITLQGEGTSYSTSAVGTFKVGGLYHNVVGQPSFFPGSSPRASFCGVCLLLQLLHMPIASAPCSSRGMSSSPSTLVLPGTPVIVGTSAWSLCYPQEHNLCFHCNSWLWQLSLSCFVFVPLVVFRFITLAVVTVGWSGTTCASI
jgi:hypothetical protein